MPDPILFVEDDESLRGILARHLAARGFEIAEAASAESAQRLLADGLRPALVILDINLPGATGWDLLRSGVIEAAGSPPILVASAITIGPRQLREFDVAGFLPKPFAIETLVDAINRVLASRAEAAR